MIRHQARMIAREAIHRPVSGDHVRIVVTAPDRLSIGFFPTGPGGPIQRRIVLKLRHVRRRVIEETLSYAVTVWTVVVLQATPQNTIDELFILFDLFLARLTKLLHRGGQPRTRTTFVAETGNPHAAILRYDLVCFAIVAHH